MKISNKGIALIKESEGCKLFAYRCPAGVPTIGYGHTAGVKMGQAITEQQAEKFLLEDLAPIEKHLNAMNINFRQEAFDALCSFIFNLGIKNFTDSTLRKKIVARASDIDVADQIIRWTRAGGKVLEGLQVRRIKEANMYVGRNLYYLDKKTGTIMKR